MSDYITRQKELEIEEVKLKIETARGFRKTVFPLVCLAILLIGYWVWEANRTFRFEDCISAKHKPFECKGATQP